MIPYIIKEPSGIERYYNPFLDVHSFFSPDRRTNILANTPSPKATSTHSLPKDECYCDFCIGRLDQATPEKTISFYKQDSIKYLDYPTFLDCQQKEILFRRQGNLFEIINYKYWQQKYNIQTPSDDIARISDMYQDEQTRSFLQHLLSLKYAKMSVSLDEKTISQQQTDCEAFYSGFHELLTSGRHFDKNTLQLFHSGTQQEHRVAMTMLINIIKDMTQRNPHISFVTVFQNWLAKAGASFEHWHKQILAVDFWGQILEREAILHKQNPNIYKDFVHEIITQEDLLIAENSHAIAYAETGGKMGRIVICSKSDYLRPHEHTLEEIYCMSDLTHAIVNTLPISTPYNEEWFYTPFNQEAFKTPWRIVIDLRLGVCAGFENITQILINPLSIKEVAHTIRESLKD